MRVYLFAAASAAVMFSAALAARADTISTFNIGGASVVYGMAGDTNTISGSVTIDTTLGVVQSISFTAGGLFESGVDAEYGPVVYVGSDDAKFTFTGTTLVDYAGSTYNLNGPNDLYVGWVTEADPGTGSDPTTGVAPEPSSMALMATGLVAAAWIARHRDSRLHRRQTPAAGC